MRRGLMAWDAEEIPADALLARVQRLQATMVESRQDAIILYTNFIRSGAVSYITAFSPYWADGVLLVPRDGEPVFATTLSKRVGNWIQVVSPISNLANSPTPGAVLGRLLAQSNIRRLAILELDAFPSGLYDELAAALPGVEIVDGTETFAASRVCDAVERRLLARADSIAREALGQTGYAARDAGEAVGQVEKYARARGAEEVYIAVAPDLDSGRRFLRLSGAYGLGRRFAIRATIVYKGAWVRRMLSYASEDTDRTALARADTWFELALAGIATKRALGEQIAARLGDLPGAHLVHWIAEAPIGTRPLAFVASSNNDEGTPSRIPATVLTVALDIGGIPWCGAGLAAQ
jgi:Creatinase/Prolidase N-terminal domain